MDKNKKITTKDFSQKITKSSTVTQSTTSYNSSLSGGSKTIVTKYEEKSKPGSTTISSFSNVKVDENFRRNSMGSVKIVQNNVLVPGSSLAKQTYTATSFKNITTPKTPLSYTPVYPLTKSMTSTTISKTSSPSFSSSTKYLQTPEKSSPTALVSSILAAKAFNDISKAKEKNRANKGIFYSFDDKSNKSQYNNNHQVSAITPAGMGHTIAAANILSYQAAQKPIPTNVYKLEPSSKPQTEKKSWLPSSLLYPKMGYAVILNHKNYENNRPSTREGTQYDVAELEAVFGHFNIHVVVRNDLKLRELNSEINRLKSFNFKPYECLIVVILTHGSRNEILCAKDGKYNLNDTIIYPLIMGNKTLINKPKIFIIQACKGDEEMLVIETDSIKSDRISAPATTNIFKCYATYEGFVSYRNIEKGTIFIQTFCRILKTKGKYETIFQIMTECIKELSENKQLPQVPSISSTMIESFCFGKLLK